MKRTLLAATINLALMCFLYWMLTTEPAQRATSLAKGYLNLARLGFDVARWVGHKAILAELHYTAQMEKLK